VAEPLVVRAFRKENVLILAALKRYVEAQPKQRDPQPILARNQASTSIAE